MKSKLSFDVYVQRDYRVRCHECKKWMKYYPTKKTPLQRRKAPNAGHCVKCPTKVEVKEAWEAAIGKPFVPGYHTSPIRKGVLGKISKIREELDELEDAERQGIRVMMLVELSDLIGAIEHFLSASFPTMTLDDLVKMKNATERAFENGRRK
jgi:hypothetical protein